MGMVIGKTNVEEPAFEVLLKQQQQLSKGGVPYEIRKYGTRFAVEAPNVGDKGFGTLAKYIGVFGKPENEGQKSIAMTAPVVKESAAAAASGTSTTPTAIAMTAPVVKKEEIMQFILPSQFDSVDKIPKPTNPAVQIRELPPAVGAVHQYSGSYAESVTNNKVLQLVRQLQADGLTASDDDDRIPMTEEFAMENYLWFGYHPPFTLPPFRRIEVWLPLSSEQVERLVEKNAATAAEWASEVCGFAEFIDKASVSCSLLRKLRIYVPIAYMSCHVSPETPFTLHIVNLCLALHETDGPQQYSVIHAMLCFELQFNSANT